MKGLVGVLVAIALVAVAGLAFAQMGGAMGTGIGSGMVGPGMMGGMMGSGEGLHGDAAGHCSGLGQDQANAPSITEDEARAAAQRYADQYLPAFTIDKVQAFAGMHGTMYVVELKGPSGEIQVLHVNPWGDVMPGHGSSRSAT